VSKYFFIALMLLSSSVFAEDLSSCTLKKEEDQRNYCKASFAGSGTFCDQIKNGELRRDCTFMVIRIQRENAYKIRNAKKEEPAAE
jgi:hypothetical protein